MRLIDLDELEKFPIRKEKWDTENGSVDFMCGVESVIEYANLLYEKNPIGEIFDLLISKDFVMFGGGK